jgi:hypothetical protein
MQLISDIILVDWSKETGCKLLTSFPKHTAIHASSCQPTFYVIFQHKPNIFKRILVWRLWGPKNVGIYCFYVSSVLSPENDEKDNYHP